MVKLHRFKDAKPSNPILVATRKLENLMLDHKDEFNSRGYGKPEHVELVEPIIRDAIHELKIYSMEALARRFDVYLFERGKCFFMRLDVEDDKWYYFFLA